jgi:peptidoglycan/xylan/chitin deacetylase (PgdA/CDA1 family)
MTAAKSFAVPVLMYHQIADRTESTSRLTVSPGIFADQLALLHDNGFQALSGAQLARARAGNGVLPPRPIVLTFDDGYGDFHSTVLPLLQRYGFVATLFVTTGWVGRDPSSPSAPAPAKMLSWSQLGELVRSGVEVGAHTRSHPQLDQIPADRARHELTASKDELEQRLGRPVLGMAYPFGYSNGRVRRQASEVGYDYAFAVANALVTADSDVMALPRLTIRRFVRPGTFERIVEGCRLASTFTAQRTATRGWAVVRRGRAAVGGVVRGQ